MSAVHEPDLACSVFFLQSNYKERSYKCQFPSDRFRSHFFSSLPSHGDRDVAESPPPNQTCNPHLFAAKKFHRGLTLFCQLQGFHHRICIPVPISITWLTFSIFTESENQKTAGPLLQLTVAGNVSLPFPPPCLQESSVKFKQTH